MTEGAIGDVNFNSCILFTPLYITKEQLPKKLLFHNLILFNYCF
nr:MAG TPA: hypothetical protein [Caudoviricetes sp.]